MNKGIWKTLTIIGFVLAIVAVGMIVVSRFAFLWNAGSMAGNNDRMLPQSQEVAFSDTQSSTEENTAMSATEKNNLSRLQQGCFSGNDCVPSIDEPKFVSVKQAKFMNADDLVVGVAFDGWQNDDDPVKAYPLKILNWHEVINDFLNEIPLVVTYSPLTMSPRVYERTFDGKAVEFGVSDKILNSGVVLYDRDSKTLWNQFDGMALAGTKTGGHLVSYPLQLVTWGEWIKEYPSTVVLSEDTGVDRPYDQYPYNDYQESSDVYYSLEHSDNRLDPKDVVYAVTVGDQRRMYPEKELQKTLPAGGGFDDQFAGVHVKISYAKKRFSAVNTDTGKDIPFEISYYFAEEAFYPGSDIYRAGT